MHATQPDAMDLVFDMHTDQICLSASDVSNELHGTPFSHATVVPDMDYFFCMITIDGRQLRVPWDADIHSEYTGEAQEVLAEMYDSYHHVMERLWSMDTGCGIIQIDEEGCTVHNSLGVYDEVGNVENFDSRSKPSTDLTPIQCIHQILQVGARARMRVSVCARLLPSTLDT